MPDYRTITGAKLVVPDEPEREWPPAFACLRCERVVFAGHVDAHRREVECEPVRRRWRCRKCGKRVTSHGPPDGWWLSGKRWMCGGCDK